MFGKNWLLSRLLGIIGVFILMISAVGLSGQVLFSGTPVSTGVHDGKVHFVEVGFHPERQDDEIYLYNINPFDQKVEDFGWKTARLGKVAYCTDGKTVMDEYHKLMYPVFVKKSELVALGYTLKE